MQRKVALSPSLPSDLKYTNRTQVINAFLGNGALSANGISAEIGLSRQTVMKSIQFFLRKGVLVSAGKGDSTSVGGKRPELFQLSPERYFLCITIWPQDLSLHLFTIGKQLVDSLALITPLPAEAKTAIDNVGRLAKQLLEKNRIRPEQLYAVSLSTSGTVDYATGRLKYSSQTPMWGTDLPLKDYLRPYFAPGTMIFLENAGKMTARPFLLEPELSGKRVLVMFTCWGLSSCLIEKNHILSGKNSLIGEIGHMIIDPGDEELCGCGGRGCFERLVSEGRVRKIVAEKRERYPDSPLLRGSLDQLTIPELFEASRAADPLAREVADYLAGVFATGLRNISLVFDPDLVVFQGDYASADDYFDQKLRVYLQGFQYYPPDGPCDIQYDKRPLAEMNALGSYTALVERYFDTPELYFDPPV